MKEILKQLLDSKENLWKAQRLFSRILEQRYPALVQEDSQEFERKINDELQFLLSSCVKYKTGRILISAPKLGWKKKVVLTRNPGLKYPHECYEAFKLIRIKNIDQEGNFIGADWNDKAKIMMGVLKNSDQIDQEKFRKFYELLELAIIWQNRTDQMMNNGCSDDKKKVMVGEDRIKIYNQHFELGILKPKDKGKYDRWEEIDSYEIIDYASDKDINHQDMLTKFWKKFEDFDEALKSQEKLKAELIKRAENLLKDLKDFNKPFKVLMKLINS
ncbi:unnamed protein product [marine sediment metagenome]|uniref:Uncharacterized protein n=1 Tax=marine sediment metagenome TaxID=412755 RepID=X1MBK3_9ZZZZ